MERIAAGSVIDRKDLIEKTASRKGMTPAAVEKDFWICWALNRIFSNAGLRATLMFKGGTSLSKVFKLIERFSEDIDLILKADEVTDQDLLQERTKSGRDKFLKKIEEDSVAYIREQLVPAVREVLRDQCTVEPDPNKAEQILIAYPAEFASKYLRPQILLEIGPRAAWAPNGEFTITPFIAEMYPSAFAQPSCFVQAVLAERTFWEKATILHAEAFRPEDKVQPRGYSRHYYDLARMAVDRVKDRALDQLDLLALVVDFKQKCWPTTWAHYEEAVPSKFKLIPPKHVERILREDYAGMREMFYGDFPPFDEVLATLAALEQEINNLPSVGARPALMAGGALPVEQPKGKE